MRSIWIVFFVVGCSREEAIPPTDPAVERARDLAGAGERAVLLCGVVDRWPGTVEAQQALARAALVRAKAIPAWAEAARTRGMRPEVNALVEGMLAASAADPCRNYATVHLSREVSSESAMLETVTGSNMIVGELIRFSRDWADMPSVAQGIATALEAASAEWLSVYASLDPPPEPRYPWLHVRFQFVHAGFVQTEQGARFPAFEIRTTLETQSAGGTTPPVPVVIGTTRLPATFDVGFLAQGSGERTPPGNAVVAEEVRLLWNAFGADLPRQLGLAPPDPAFAPFAGNWSLTGTSRGDGCGGQIALGAQHLRVDAVTRTAHADVVDRTYAARVEADALAADGRFSAEGACLGTSINERWLLRRTPEGMLTGSLDSTWRLPPNCETACTATFDLVARPAAP